MFLAGESDADAVDSVSADYIEYLCVLFTVGSEGLLTLSDVVKQVLNLEHALGLRSFITVSVTYRDLRASPTSSRFRIGTLTWLRWCQLPISVVCSPRTT